jgi:uncharacterized alkaline shock family protein YloU
VEGQPQISPDVLARYAGDAAREVPGVSGLAESQLHRGKGVDVSGSDAATAMTIHVELEWGSSAKAVSGEVQRRVDEYLERMAGLKVASVDVVVEGVGAPPAKQ